MRFLHRSLLPFLLLGLHLFSASALAQEGPEIERLEVALWPEYDRPAVLVFYQVQLPGDTSLPTRIDLSIPAAVGEPHAVATREIDGSLVYAEFTRQVAGDWATISVLTNSLEVWLEYYDDLKINGEERNYTFVWPGGVDLGMFAYDVQQPVGATGMVVTPLGESSIGDDGLLHYRGELVPQSSSSILSVNLAYTKSTSKLTVEMGFPDPSFEGTEAAEEATPDLGTFLPLIIGSIGVALLVIGGLIYFRLRREEKSNRASRRRRRPAGKQVKETRQRINASLVFCHNCGEQAGASDRFCRHCGKHLRR